MVNFYTIVSIQVSEILHGTCNKNIQDAAMKRKQLIVLARKLGVSEQYYTSPIKRLIWAIQEADGQDMRTRDEELYSNSDNNQWRAKK
jgi:hypothetical protein